jgi:ATP-dependent helicase HrpA
MTRIEHRLRIISRLANKALLVDRHSARRELDRLRNLAAAERPEDELLKRCDRVEKRLEASAAICRQRIAAIPLPESDADLPIRSKRDDLIAAIQAHPVVIVAGETGSGKTTQLPKYCIAAGLGVYGAIAVTQPRRIAAITVANRIAEEIGQAIGPTVGYKIRFSDTSQHHSRIKIMTDGILLAEAHRDPFLNQYDTVIVDEAHERNLNIDFILGILRKLLQRRRDLKVVVTSATIDTQKFSQAFGNAPVVEVSGRLYPVETRYAEPAYEVEEESGHIDAAVRVVEGLIQERRGGDILVFMPTEQDIRDTCDLLDGRDFGDIRIMPLFARLSAAEQQRVFHSDGRRKIVVATNVAETSITIPGIHYVIDSGLARISQYTPRSRTTTLPVVPVSQSSADQRKGRCGRVANGVCIRLYSEEDYCQRPRYTAPEIQRANLAEVILRMIALRLGDVDAFPFIDAPAPRSIQDGYRLLVELGAIRLREKSRPGDGKYVLTERGRMMARLPLDPRLSRMLLAAHENGCLDDTVVIAAALSIQDPRERPVEKQAQADAAHARFADPHSDFLALLKMWHAYSQVLANRSSWAAVKKFCRDSFLSFRRLREWRDVYEQLHAVLAEHDIEPGAPSRPPDPPGDPADSRYAALHRAILSGFLANIALKKEKQIFLAAYGRQAMIFPGSGLFKNPGQWIVAAEMVETSRLFARCAAVIKPTWLEEVGRDQCAYGYSDPHWERRREQVTATEQVTLFGLAIDRRPCAYGPLQPDEAAEIFYREALIGGDVRKPLPFMAHNAALVADIQGMEDRLRRRDLLVEEEAMMEFYRRRLPRVYDLATLKRRIREAGGDQFLRMTRADLLIQEPSNEALARYPDRIQVGRRNVHCDYRFDPGHEADGVTVRVEAAAAHAVRIEHFQWLVPGLLPEKVAAMIKALPKQWRKQLVPVADTAAVIAAEMPVQRGTVLAAALSAFIQRRFGIAIPPAAWNETELPDHLRMRIAVTDERGDVIRTGRDASVLHGATPSEPDNGRFAAAVAAFERIDLRDWDFGPLAETIDLRDADGRKWVAHPALVLKEGCVVLTALADPVDAERRHRQGVRALLQRQFQADVKYLRKNLALPPSYHSAARLLGGHTALEAQLLERVLDVLMAKNVRTPEEFRKLSDAVRREGLAGEGRDVRQRLLAVLEAYREVHGRLKPMGLVVKIPGPLGQFRAELLSELGRLVPPDFILRYDAARLEHLPRYLKALAIRAERGLVDLEKDRIKAGRVALYAARWTDLNLQLSSQNSPEKHRAMDELFWLIEEFKISIFAQEIKTAKPISAKRLEEQIAAIEAMV